MIIVKFWLSVLERMFLVGILAIVTNFDASSLSISEERVYGIAFLIFILGGAIKDIITT